MQVRELIFIFFNKLNRILKKFNFITAKNSESKLIVYILHRTDIKYFDEYYRLLKRINFEAPFIKPSEIEKFFYGKLGKGSKSLLTFDDGFKNNFLFSKKVLDPLGIRAIFFVVPFFINKTNNIEFFNSLYPGNVIRTKDLSEFIHLSFRELDSLIKDGHEIGIHGYKHESATDIELLEYEGKIKKALKILEKRSIYCNHFAYPFGSKKFFNKKTSKLLSKYFKYIHLGVRGLNFSMDKKIKIIKRHTIATINKDYSDKPYSYEQIYFFAFNSLARKLVYIYHKFKIN